MLKRSLAVLALVLLAACGGGSEAEPLSPAQASKFFTNIDALLDQTVKVHAEGDTDQAAELAGQAYLENFEFLEHDLEEADHELNERIEGLLGPAFRKASSRERYLEARPGVTAISPDTASSIDRAYDDLERSIERGAPEEEVTELTESLAAMLTQALGG